MMICDTCEILMTVMSTCCGQYPDTRQVLLLYHIQRNFDIPTAEEYNGTGFEEGTEAVKLETIGVMQGEESEADGDAFFRLERGGLRQGI